MNWLKRFNTVADIIVLVCSIISVAYLGSKADSVSQLFSSDTLWLNVLLATYAFEVLRFKYAAKAENK